MQADALLRLHSLAILIHYDYTPCSVRMMKPYLVCLILAAEAVSVAASINDKVRERRVRRFFVQSICSSSFRSFFLNNELMLRIFCETVCLTTNGIKCYLDHRYQKEQAPFTQRETSDDWEAAHREMNFESSSDRPEAPFERPLAIKRSSSLYPATTLMKTIASWKIIV